MACVFIGDKKYVLNAADKYNPAWLIPYDVINNDAFIVDKVNGGWIYLEDKKDIFQNVVFIYSEISPEGIMKGEATVYQRRLLQKSKSKEMERGQDFF